MEKSEKTAFGCGCFWGIQYLFDKVYGVKKTDVGYMGGDEKMFPNPSYEDVCSNESGFAEVVHITFNPEKVSYKQLLEVFWKSHDPTTLNRQGADSGTQYRSVVFYHNAEQKDLASKFATKVKLSVKDNGKGAIEIPFVSTDDLNRILALLDW